ncbi:MAG: substrate-binding domain-containing protein [Hungatella hathewayi]|uniref:sugar ABC transporter substrate-binding protein n=1 Tax=Hungatella TaxID=1649459 RepID=UPI00110601B1|nr:MULTISPECIES: substrate-binding domain-containing protein [Hungatella]MCI7381974.1 substrate-binding domain-containing protein [Hungatella sp.]MDY6236523.1 substrate-binding domain-containing protein [Hungatella hathewayi]
MKKRRIAAIVMAMVLGVTGCSSVVSTEGETTAAGTESKSTLEAEEKSSQSGDTKQEAETEMPEAGDYHIGFVVHTTSGDVMSSIEYGAKAAAEDYGVKLTYTGPVDTDNTEQISMFESLVAAGCDAIVIIAGDPTVWDEPIKEAVDKGISVIVTDTDAPTSQRAAYFGVDTAKLALDLGTAVREKTGEEGAVALGVCVLGPASHTTRAEKVKEAYSGTGMEFIGVYETDQDTTLNYNNWENIYTSNPDLKAMVGLSALETTNMGKVKQACGGETVMAAYDPGAEALNLLEEGYLDVCAFQNVWLEGYLPVQAAARMLTEGKKLKAGENLYEGQIVTSSEVTEELKNRAQSEATMNAWYRNFIKENGLEDFGLSE